ncbi:hypothetical protein [Nannocystis pusilla]|uniref:hypothetical protein n=1 Tax=Nannocystis pusilla TaxID=889268 RepID=UPI003B79F25D
MLLACRTEPVVRAELEEVCGAPSPFRVLPFAGDEVVRASETVRVQDRVVYVVSRLDPFDVDAVYSSDAASTVWSAGPCGEAPQQLASGIDDIFTVDVWPDLVLGCEKATGNVVVLDPTGAAEPHVAFPAVPQFPLGIGCGLGWTDFGLLSLDAHDEETGALMLHPFPADPRAGVSSPEVLLDAVRFAPSSGGGPGMISGYLYTFRDHVLALTPEETLVRVELADRSVSTLQTDVAAFSATPPFLAPEGGRYLVWQDAAVTKDDPSHPEGAIFLRDQVEGGDVLLGETALRWTFEPLWHGESGLVQLNLGNPLALGARLRLFLLPELDSVEFAGDLRLNAVFEGGRLVGGSLFRDDFIDLLEVPGGERARLFPREAEYVGRDADAVRLLEVPQCCIDSDFRAEGPLWRVPLDGSVATQLAERATRFMTDWDGRLIGPLDAGARWLSSLVVIDTETRAEARIDESVHFHSIDASRVNEEGIVSYSVADGERSGSTWSGCPRPSAAANRGRRSPSGTSRSTSCATATVDRCRGCADSATDRPRRSENYGCPELDREPRPRSVSRGPRWRDLRDMSSSLREARQRLEAELITTRLAARLRRESHE